MERKMSAGNDDAMDVRNSDDHVTPNVGGCHNTTTQSTLTRDSDSMLGNMFSERMPSTTDANGAYFIDAHGKIFDHVLTFLRRGKLCLPQDFKDWDLLAAEADFYQIEELMNILQDERNSREGLVKLNVGGYLYTTERSTLTKYPDSKLNNIISGGAPSLIDSNGAYVIDANGQNFAYVLDFLRRGKLYLPEDFKDWDVMAAEANFYGIKELEDAVKATRQKRSMEFVEISIRVKCSEIQNEIKICKYAYTGSRETLENLSLVQELFESASEGKLRRNIVAYEFPMYGTLRTDVSSAFFTRIFDLNRPELFQQITNLGFELKTAPSVLNLEAEQELIWTFARRIQGK